MDYFDSGVRDPQLSGRAESQSQNVSLATVPNATTNGNIERETETEKNAECTISDVNWDIILSTEVLTLTIDSRCVFEIAKSAKTANHSITSFEPPMIT